MTVPNPSIDQLVADELRRARPKTQEECCALAARVSIKVSGAPQTDDEFLAAGYGAAQGLFGPAYEQADEGQRWTWIDMCERALREQSRQQTEAS